MNLVVFKIKDIAHSLAVEDLDKLILLLSILLRAKLILI